MKRRIMTQEERQAENRRRDLKALRIKGYIYGFIALCFAFPLYADPVFDYLIIPLWKLFIGPIK